MWSHIRYDRESYCCEHFVIDAYRHYTSIDLTEKLLDESGFFCASKLRNFIPIDKPKQHCLVMFRSPNRAHVGLWLDGKVLHLEELGVTWQPVKNILRKFDRVVFYELSNTRN